MKLTVPLKDLQKAEKRIAELEAQLKMQSAYELAIAELEQDKQHLTNVIEEWRQENRRQRDAIAPDDDSILRQILLDVYDHTNGKEWVVLHKLQKALEDSKKLDTADSEG